VCHSCGGSVRGGSSGVEQETNDIEEGMNDNLLTRPWTS
jgi:hypothetical protein